MAVIGNDRIEGLDCACAKLDNAAFTIGKDAIVCTWCGRRIPCVTPIEFVTKAHCECSPDRRTTHVIDAERSRICTKCSLRK